MTVLFLNIKVSNGPRKKIFLCDRTHNTYLNFPHIFLFIQQVRFQILIKNHFLLKSKKWSFWVVDDLRAKTKNYFVKETKVNKTKLY